MDSKWKDLVLNNLDYYKIVRAPYFESVMDFLKVTFETPEQNLSKLLVHFLTETTKYLGLDFKSKVFSEMNVEIGKITDPGDWALEISSVMGASIYVNPTGGKEIFDSRKFQERGISLKFLEPKFDAYNQKTETFNPGLSIIDVMMFNSSERTREILQHYELS